MIKLCDCCGKNKIIGSIEKREPKYCICDECKSIYEKVKLLKSERDLVDDKPIFIVYSTKDIHECAWIESVFMDGAEGFAHMEELQNSKEYGYLNWSNQTMLVKK